VQQNAQHFEIVGKYSSCSQQPTTIRGCSAPPGSMAPVMSMLAAAQTDIMTLSADDLKEALKRFDKAPDVGRMGMFTHHPDDIGASMQVLEDVITMVEYCAAYGMGHITMEQKFHLFISSGSECECDRRNLAL